MPREKVSEAGTKGGNRSRRGWTLVQELPDELWYVHKKTGESKAVPK